MRQALRTNRARTQVSVGASVPAPVGGWDAQNPLAAMPSKNAVLLENWIPRPGYVEVRRGYQPQVVGFSNPVETLMVWRGSQIAVDKMFAASSTMIYDVSQQGTPLGAPVYTGAISARWQYTNFANDAGSFIICVNGQNVPTHYDGASFTNLVITGSSGPIVLDPTHLIDVMAHKSRLHFVERNSKRVWFLDVEAIQGAAQLLDLGPVFQKGGEIICQATWSLDGGQGPDDFAAWMTSEGEVAVYQGTDPSDATNWALVGVYSLGLPLGRRAIIKYGADLVILTTDGVVPLSQALKLDRAQDNLVALTALIQNAFANAARTYGDNFGWQGTLYQKGQLAIINVPTSELVAGDQFVQNVQTGAWGHLLDIPAVCWEIANGNPYFGAPDGVYQWDTGSVDFNDPIVADVQPAFNYFGRRGEQKKFEMIRPLLRADVGVQPALEILTNYQEAVPTAVPTTVTAVGALWGSSLWGQATWSTSTAIRNDWTSVTGIGYCGAPRMRVSLASMSQYMLDVGDGTYLDIGDGEVVAYQSNASSDLAVQLIGFDLIYQGGGQL